MSHPYQGLPDPRFWRSVGGIEPHLLDPVVKPAFTIAASDRVATAGSCFAQHIAQALPRLGLDYFVAETGDGLSEAERAGRQYGLFSARYGNIYTAIQLAQLLEQAFGERQPLDLAWERPKGGWIDPFRPTVEPDGFASPKTVAEDRARHLAAVRRLVSELDVFVFTLGLTEAWRARADGSVYALAPGVAGGAYDPELHEFVNFGVAETESALIAAVARIKSVNPGARVLLTVSPVPLVATYEDRSVLVSNTYSKAVLRVAAEAAARRHDWIDYFPSYEIITGPATGGLYFEADARSVNTLGVAHVMRVFRRHYVEGATDTATVPPVRAILAENNVVCDEALIESLRGH